MTGATMLHIDNFYKGGFVMVMPVYFINHRNFSSKSGQKYHVLTVCDDEGEISEFFHDEDVFIPNVCLFCPLLLDVSVSKYKGSTRITLLRADVSSADSVDPVDNP